VILVDSKVSQPVDSQAQRRVKYGLNLAVVTVVAVALCVLINFISYRTLREGWARIDTSHLGRYSLSEQTRAVLRDLRGDYRIVTVFSETSGLAPEDALSQSEQIEQATALAELYGQYNRHITVEQLRPAYDLGRMDKFYEQLRTRYADQTRPVAAAVGDARQIMADLHGQSTALADKLKKLAQEPALPDGTLRNYLIGALQVSAGLAQRTGEDDKQVRTQLGTPLPDYGGARDLLTREFEAFAASKAFDAMVTAMRARVLPAVPEAPKELQPQATEAVQAVIKLFDEAPKRLGAALAGLRGGPSLEEYSRLQGQIAAGNAVLVMGPKSVRVLQLSQFFPAPGRHGAAGAAAAGGSRSLFLGEERLTGALVSLADVHPPLVVFVGTGNQPVFGPDGLYNAVADRLRSMDFQVEAWSPYQHSPEGETREVPPPQPAAGAKAVWVLLPNESPSPYGSLSPNEQRAVEYVKQRLGAGDSALVVLAVMPASPFGEGAANPVTTMLEPMGISARLDEVVLQELTSAASSHPGYAHEFLIENWPQDLVISKSLQGLSGLFLRGCPLTLSSGPDGKARTWPLAEVRGNNFFAQELNMSQQDVKRDPATAKDSYVLAAAAERGPTRVVVLGDALAATDMVTTYPMGGYTQDAAGKAELYGAAYPANAELFINSVYWLSGNERLIAASPRSQDIRRVQGDLTATGRLGLGVTLMGAVALVTLAAGLAVGLARRRA
jgi:hypothetical protein